MNDRPNELLRPFRFANGVASPNRVWVAPMTNTQSHDDGSLSDVELAWLEARAAGGFGVIESCATHVTVDGQGWNGEWGIFDDAHTADWARAARAMHAHDALLIAQLYHGGERALRVDGRVPFSATAHGEPGTETEVRAASIDDIERVIDAFGRAAERAAEAGVDGVELHAAHGYLLCQFLRADRNTRTDGWGGSLEGRARLLRAVVTEIRSRVPSSFVVGVRLSPENSGVVEGLDLDESVQTAQWVCEDGADFVHVSLWDIHKNTAKRPNEHPTEVFSRALPSDVPLVTAGEVWTVEDALAEVERGAAAVALGRGAILNPDWPHAVARDGNPPLLPPVSAAQLRERALSDGFIDYLKRWRGLIDEADGGRPAE